jgi:hypothetical protein
MPSSASQGGGGQQRDRWRGSGGGERALGDSIGPVGVHAAEARDGGVQRAVRRGHPVLRDKHGRERLTVMEQGGHLGGLKNVNARRARLARAARAAWHAAVGAFPKRPNGTLAAGSCARLGASGARLAGHERGTVRDGQVLVDDHLMTALTHRPRGPHRPHNRISRRRTRRQLRLPCSGRSRASRSRPDMVQFGTTPGAANCGGLDRTVRAPRARS